jgi:dTDP-glucose 4,6-dehydratase
MSKILVTGADGFIGSHLTEELVKMGHHVKALVHYNSSGSWGWLDHVNSNIIDNVEVIAGDIRDANFVHKLMKNCNIVYHLAALIAIPYSYLAPRSYVETNIIGTLNVLQSAADLGVDRVLHTSTSEVYGSAQILPIPESHPLVGQSPYSASKIAADQLALAFHSSYGLPVVTVRPFNTFGPRQSMRAVIPSIIGQISAGVDTISIGALDTSRDFTFISDTVNGFITIGDSVLGIGETFNLGTGYEISIGELLNTIVELMAVKINTKMDFARVRPAKSEVNRLLSDNSKVKNTFGWAPAYTNKNGLEKALLRTIEWFSDPKNLILYKTNLYNI